MVSMFLTIQSSPSTLVSRHSLSSKRDPHGLADYMLGRTYLYPFMRFATPDVARDGWNLYGYTGGNPVNYVDPDGPGECPACKSSNRHRSP